LIAAAIKKLSVSAGVEKTVHITLLQGWHSVGESNLHLQFTQKYRRTVFEDAVLRNTGTKQPFSQLTHKQPYYSSRIRRE